LERTRWIPVGLLVVVGIAAAMQFAKVAAIFVPVAAVYDASDTATALLLSAPAFVGLVLGLTAGVYVARLGFRRVLLWCLGIGTVLGLMRVSPVPSLRWLGTSYVTLLRNTPLTVIMLFLVLGVWGQLKIELAPDFNTNFFLFAIVGLAIYHAAFVCEAVRSGINTVPLGQAE
ncbi:hypothetical protein U6M47_13140, partial [Cutibacterium acnes]